MHLSSSSNVIISLFLSPQTLLSAMNPNSTTSIAKQLLTFTSLFILISNPSVSNVCKVLLLLLPSAIFFLIFILKPSLSKPRIYMVDFACFKPPTHCRVPFTTFIENASAFSCFTQETLTSMSKILHNSGLSQETHLPPPLLYIPPKAHFQESIHEAHMVLFSAMEDLLSKTKTSPQDIDILIVNCSGFCPAPSLSSIIVNKFKLRDGVKSYSLAGMGCSAGIAAIDAAKNLLTTNRTSNAVVLSTEILTTGWYSGNDLSMLSLNCFFRMGGAAVLLTNKPQANHTPKYKLLHSLRTQTASIDAAYYSAYRDEDSDRKTGFRVGQGLMKLVTDTIRPHVSILGHHVLPLPEKLRHILTSFRRMVTISQKGILKHQGHVPDFKTAIDHFILPTSGRPWVREIGKGLRLDERDVEPTLMTLHRFGNQSSSSIWYELAYIEGKERVKEGDKVWQLGFGSGLKCCSAVWECVRPVVGEASGGPWGDCIHRYPVSEAMAI